jgi:glycosyltransferase involved in cell wall biosynthesis
MANKFEPYSSLSILWDVDLPWRSGSKYVHLWTPQDPRIYNNPRVERDLDVTFVGSQGYQERHSAITYLKNNGVEVTTAGGQKSMLDVNQYANLLQRSKISLNFCQNNEGFSQLKGRIFESTSCGAMLMESQHDVNWIERWFLPMVHYVPFTNHEDLKNKINYYLSNDEERNRIAENGWRKTMESYSNVAWWSYVLKECGIEYE